MRRNRVVLWLLASIFVLAACGPSPVPPLPTRARTPVPTWTLPFDLRTGTATPAESVAVIGPTAAATLEPSNVESTDPPTPPPDSETSAAAAPSGTPPPSPTARPGIDPTL